MSLSTLAGHFVTLGVDHVFLGLFFFAASLRLILVFFAFRFFVICGNPLRSGRLLWAQHYLFSLWAFRRVRACLL
jgi:hypothetical protein